MLEAALVRSKSRSKPPAGLAWIFLVVGIILVLAHFLSLVTRLLTAPPAVCPVDAAKGLPLGKYRPDILNVESKDKYPLRHFLYIIDDNELHPNIKMKGLTAEINSNQYRKEEQNSSCTYFTIDGDSYLEVEPLYPKIRVGKGVADREKRTAAFIFAAALTRDFEAAGLFSRNQPLSRVRDVFELKNPADTAFRLFEIDSTNPSFPDGLVCLANRGIDSEITGDLDATSADQVQVRAESLASQICYTFITSRTRMGWTPLPSFFSTNWQLSGRDTFFVRTVWAVDRFTLNITAFLREKQKQLGD